VTNERFLQLGQVVAGQFSSVHRAVNKPLACAVTITVTTAWPDDETDRPTGGVRYVFSGLCQRLSTGAIAEACSMETAPPRVITIIIIIISRVAGEVRRVVAPLSLYPRPTSKAPIERVESSRSWSSHLLFCGRPGGRRHVRPGDRLVSDVFS